MSKQTMLEAGSEEELRVAVCIREGFAGVGGPSEASIVRIRFAARQSARRRQASRVLRHLAAVAAVALLVVGGLALNARRQAAATTIADDQLTNFVLAYQGLDQDSYFTTDSTDSLWF